MFIFFSLFLDLEYRKQQKQYFTYLKCAKSLSTKRYNVLFVSVYIEDARYTRRYKTCNISAESLFETKALEAKATSISFGFKICGCKWYSTDLHLKLILNNVRDAYLPMSRFFCLQDLASICNLKNYIQQTFSQKSKLIL